MGRKSLLRRLWSLEDKADHILDRLKTLTERIANMSVELDQLEVQVKANTDAEQSAIALLTKLSEMIKAAGTDPVKLKQLTTDLDASKKALAEAILANTPADPGTPAPPAAPKKGRP